VRRSDAQAARDMNGAVSVVMAATALRESHPPRPAMAKVFVSCAMPAWRRRGRHVVAEE
jgi:hypothetical protein